MSQAVNLGAAPVPSAPQPLATGAIGMGGEIRRLRTCPMDERLPNDTPGCMHVRELDMSIFRMIYGVICA